MTGQHDAFAASTGVYVLGALAPEERASFEAHLRSCPLCAAEVASLTDIAQALDQAVPAVDPPPQLRERILASVRLDAARAPRAVDRGVEEVRFSPVPVERRARSWPLWTGWMAAAASLAVAALLWQQASGLRGRLQEAEQRVADAVERWRDAEGRLEVVTQDADRARVQFAAATAVDATAFTLKGQAVAPSAAARAYLSRSRGLLLTASNLPPLAPGRTYQLWYLTRSAPVSAGLLRPDAEGSATVQFSDVPVGIAPVGLAVSNEPDGGVPAPTGAIYLAGQAGG